MVLYADNLLWVPLSPSIMRAYVPQLFMNDPSLTAIAASYLVDLAMCASASSDVW